MKVKVIRIELYIIDHDNIGAEGSVSEIVSSKYLHPIIGEIKEKEVDWVDDNPLNYKKTSVLAARELFKE
jgi:hypothetical protein